MRPNPRQAALAVALAAAVLSPAGAMAQTSATDASRLNRLAAELSTGEWQELNLASLRLRFAIHSGRDDVGQLSFSGERAYPLYGVGIHVSPNATGEWLQTADRRVKIERYQDDCVKLTGDYVKPGMNRTAGDLAGVVPVDSIFCPSSSLVTPSRGRWVGRWETALGTLEIERGRGNVLRGWFSRPDGQGNVQRYRRVSFGLLNRETLLGGWSSMTNEGGRGVQIVMDQAGDISGRIWLGDDSPTIFTGRRLDQPSEQPAPPSTPNQPTPGPSTPVPAPGPSTPSPSGAGFEAIGDFGVRFERLERVQGGVVRAVVTIRNHGETVQYLPSGTFRAILTDADGAGQERNQLWRGSGEPAQLFNGTPTLQPDGELTVRFVFNPDTPQLRSLVLMRGTAQVEFDLGGR